MREIGSEFWRQYETFCGESKVNEVNLLSGRTALQFIIDDIRKQRNIHKVLMPSYCCESMILPFVRSGIEVAFYPIHRNEIEFPQEHDADVAFLIDYFGYRLECNHLIARHEKQKGNTVIYDATHKLDGNPDVEANADYSFCSYRKWFYCNYARAVCHNRVLDWGYNLSTNRQYVQLRDKAASEKKKYIDGLTNDKETFLTEFHAAEEILDEDYIGYAGVPVEFNLQVIKLRRRENAAYLLHELKDIPQLKLWRAELQPEDIPMFVPVLVDPQIRSELRMYLISKQIYCPIHWPRTSHQMMDNELYDTELSLICDQRYDLTDMVRMVDAIKEFFNR